MQGLRASRQEAYVAGVSTRKVDQVVESLGLRVSKSEVSRICQGLDEQVDAFRNRPLEGRYPYLWLDAKIHCAPPERLMLLGAADARGGNSNLDSQPSLQVGRAGLAQTTAATVVQDCLR